MLANASGAKSRRFSAVRDARWAPGALWGRDVITRWSHWLPKLDELFLIPDKPLASVERSNRELEIEIRRAARTPARATSNEPALA